MINERRSSCEKNRKRSLLFSSGETVNSSNLTLRSSIIRHDPVTARAISRLSHGIARLSANSDSVSNKYFRSGHLCKNAHNDLNCESNLNTNTKPRLTIGSKRKWEADKMEMDVIVDRVQSYSNNNSVATVSNINALNLQSTFLPIHRHTPLVMHRSMSSDNLASAGHYSSGSSMLSITSLSEQSDASSHNHDADVEDEMDDHHFRCKLMKGSRRKSGQDKLINDVCWKMTKHSFGIDSSDGLSMNLKIPRLHSIYPHTIHHISSPERSFIKQSPLCRSSEDVQMKRNNSSLSNLTYRSRHKHKSSEQKKCISDSNNNDNNNNTCAKYLSKGSLLKTFVNSSTTSSTSSEDVSKLKKSKSRKYRKDKSSNELSDAVIVSSKCEQNIFVKKSMTVASECSTNTDSSNINLPSNQNTVFENSLPIDEIDPELHELFRDTWPLLSNRAKENYIKGVKHSTERRYNFISNNCENPSKLQSTLKQRQSSNTDRNFITFVQSTSGRSTPDINITLVPGGGNRMPTPPWLKSDDDTEDSEVVTQLYPVHTNMDRAGLGLWQPKLSSAAPISEVNIGHRILRKLGWNPGNGVGHNAQGIITPIGCEREMSDDTLEIS